MRLWRARISALKAHNPSARGTALGNPPPIRPAPTGSNPKARGTAPGRDPPIHPAPTGQNPTPTPSNEQGRHKPSTRNSKCSTPRRGNWRNESRQTWRRFWRRHENQILAACSNRRPVRNTTPKTTWPVVMRSLQDAFSRRCCVRLFPAPRQGANSIATSSHGSSHGLCSLAHSGPRTTVSAWRRRPRRRRTDPWSIQGPEQP